MDRKYLKNTKFHIFDYDEETAKYNNQGLSLDYVWRQRDRVQDRRNAERLEAYNLLEQ